MTTEATPRNNRGINGIAVCPKCGQACHVRNGVSPEHGCRGAG